jgi:polysaccharide biosynthesis protein PslG
MLRAAALAVALALVWAVPAAADAPRVPRDWLGVAADGPLIDAPEAHAAEWPLIARSGATSVRIAFYWARAEPAPGAVDLAVYDTPVLAAARAGLDVLPVVFATPEWARLVPGAFASPPRDPAEYGHVLGALVRRYGPNGSLWAEHPDVRPRPVREWQIWNEPNLVTYWSEQPFASRYVALLRAARQALRAADPGARAILAGLPNGWAALRQIYRAGGRRLFDAVAIHPYTQKASRVARYVEEARKVMARFGDRRKPIWVSEISWPASRGRMRDPIGIATDDRGQARRLATGLVQLARARKRMRIERVYWYTWLSEPGPASVFTWSGLRRLQDGTVVSAPSLRAYRRVARALRR